jgi:phospholipid/cholesterol/gamma-HCH transport system permease protein
MKQIILFFSAVISIILSPFLHVLHYIGSLFLLFLDAIRCLPSVIPFRRKSRFSSVLGQISKIGFEAIPIVSLMSFLLGAILALQAAKQLERFGASIYVADLVAISLTREIAPILISIIVAGRTGSAIASEIGTMMVTEEITALRAMGISPAKVLVTPKLVALFFTLPLLVVYSDLIGIIAGFGVGCFVLGLSFQDYYTQTIKIMNMHHIWAGLQKCFAFAIIIGLVGCYRGFSVQGGAEGVGRATTNAVVDSIILIVAVNFIFTFVSYFAR